MFALTVAAGEMGWMLLHEFGPDLLGWYWLHDVPVFPANVVLFLFALPVQVWAGAPFYAGAWRVGRI